MVCACGKYWEEIMYMFVRFWEHTLLGCGGEVGV